MIPFYEKNISPGVLFFEGLDEPVLTNLILAESLRMFCWLAATCKDLKKMLSRYSEYANLRVLLERPRGALCANRLGIYVSVIIFRDLLPDRFAHPDRPESARYYKLRAKMLHTLLCRCPQLHEIQVSPNLGRLFVSHLICQYVPYMLGEGMHAPSSHASMWIGSIVIQRPVQLIE